MPGFSKPIQEIIGLLVKYQRKKAVLPETLDLSKRVKKSLSRLIILLRLAILLHQGRDPETVIEPIIKASKFVIELEFPEDFLSTHPMTVLNLESEKKLLSAACFEVSFK